MLGSKTNVVKSLVVLGLVAVLGVFWAKCDKESLDYASSKVSPKDSGNNLSNDQRREDQAREIQNIVQGRASTVPGLLSADSPGHNQKSSSDEKFLRFKQNFNRAFQGTGTWNFTKNPRGGILRVLGSDETSLRVKNLEEMHDVAMKVGLAAELVEDESQLGFKVKDEAGQVSGYGTQHLFQQYYRGKGEGDPDLLVYRGGVVIRSQVIESETDDQLGEKEAEIYIINTMLEEIKGSPSTSYSMTEDEGREILINHFRKNYPSEIQSMGIVFSAQSRIQQPAWAFALTITKDNGQPDVLEALVGTKSRDVIFAVSTIKR